MTNLVASLFHANVHARNDGLYEPLSQEGQICGVGVHLSLIHDPPLDVPSPHYKYIVVVESVERRSPAARAGLSAGDIVVAVDGHYLDYARRVYLPDDVAFLIRGPAATTVEVTVQRAGQDRTARLVREPVGVGGPPPSPERGAGAGARPVTPTGAPRRAAAPVTPEALDEVAGRLDR